MPPKQVEVPPRKIEDKELVERAGLDLPNKEIVDEVLKNLPPETFEDVENLSQFLHDLDERAKDGIYQQKDRREIVDSLLREEIERRKEDLANTSRNVRTGQESQPSPTEEAEAWKQYHREQKNARQAAKEAQAFDKQQSFEKEEVFTQAADVIGEEVDKQAQEITDFKRKREEEYQDHIASDADTKQYRSVAPQHTPEGKVQDVQAHKRYNQQEIAQRNKEIKQARKKREALAQEVHQMKYGENDEWTNKQLDLEAELSKKSKKRQLESTIGYTRKEQQRMKMELPEEYAKRARNERQRLERIEEMKNFDGKTFAEEVKKWNEGKSKLTIEEIRNKLPKEAVESFIGVKYSSLKPEQQAAYSKALKAEHTYAKPLGLRAGDQEYFNDGVAAREFIRANGDERTEYVRDNKLHHKQTVDALKAMRTHMEKIKGSNDPKLREQYRILSKNERLMQKQEGYTLDSVQAMERYKHHDEKMEGLKNAFMEGNLSLTEYATSPLKAAYYELGKLRHGQRIWEQNALLENQKNNKGIERWMRDKAIRLPRWGTNAGLAVGGGYGAYYGASWLLGPYAPLIWTGMVGYGAYKLVTKVIMPTIDKGEKISSKIDKAFGEDIIDSMFKKKKKKD